MKQTSVEIARDQKKAARQARLVEWMQEENKPLSARAQEEIRQSEIRVCLREVVTQYDGKWTTAESLAIFAKAKNQKLAPYINSKNVSEYLKTMHLPKKKILTQMYLCKKQIFFA